MTANPRDEVVVGCMRQGCGRRYHTLYGTWWKQKNSCPSCGDHKARLIGPATEGDEQ